MSFLTRFALRQNRSIITFILGIILLGSLVAANYPQKEDPSIVIRNATVSAFFSGMPPDRVENLITEPLEKKIREISEIEEIKSDSKAGVTIINVKARDSVNDIAAVWQKLRNKMDDARGQLPEGTQGPIIDDEKGLTAIASIALWAEGFTLREMKDASDDLQRALYGIDGVKKVEIFGVQSERIFLEMSNTGLAQYGISSNQIINTLQQQNVILPGGTIRASNLSIPIEPSGNFRSVSEIENLLIKLPGTNQVIKLSDIATVRRGYIDPAEKPVYYNGHQALILSVSLNDGVNSVAFGKLLTAKVADLQQSLPIGMVLEFATFQPDLVKAAVNGAATNVGQTLVIVLVCVMVFLGIRTGLIVGLIVPLSMLFAIIVMRIFDIELQRMSISAMIIALGLLVDNGIVVAEDIRRRLEEGEEHLDACLNAGKSLAVPLLTSSLTTILAFLPMLLAIGSAGEFTESISQVVIIILLASWLLSMTAIPAVANWFMKVGNAPSKAPEDGDQLSDRFNGKSYQLYEQALRALLNRKAIFLGVVAAIFAASLPIFKTIPVEFFPASDRSQFLVYIDLPAGTDTEKTTDAVSRLSTWFADKQVNPDVTSNIAYVASGGPRFYLALPSMDPDPHLGFMVVNTKDIESVPATMARARAHISEALPEAQGRVKMLSFGPGEAGLVEIRLSGTDSDYLYQKAQLISEAMAAIPGSVNIRNDWENRVVKLRIEVDQTRARRAQVTSQEIANSLSTFLSGAEVTDYREGDTIIPVVLRGVEGERSDLQILQSISVYSSATDTNVPLVQIANIVAETQFSRIKHFNQERTITVSGKHTSRKAADYARLIKPTIDTLGLKPGHYWAWGGELEDSLDAQNKLFASLPLCVAGIVVLLIWQFNSFRRPLIILLTIPLSFIGAVLGLVTLQATFGFMSILGLISLMGIIINNGIVLIDRIDQERSCGKEVREAVIAACLARLRPIVMTTITTVFGLLPLLMFGGSLWFGLATVMSFGLAIGTILTLAVVPALYILFFNAGVK
ncbi:efflux RND transporter permease subunit [Kordiimonas sp.]|uniref:efflux RND transporter permease subunit n=1 Tax=Kordiimonas sp. TaxID=1970157 RepID=UPI003A8DCCDF